ncbi:hypothetical protein [Burkholderia ubonensis]|uniref:hypothetical protein n=1 Tax=Burkholderia ubonensis TaxID=101571 RepID=UPI000760007A|nr:hypothetical protein [Burkholderia ubonensis]KWN81645.1 hypothetical protein WM25_04895 [Burkholderia ubonensis]
MTTIDKSRADALIHDYVHGLLTNDVEKAAEATKRMTDYALTNSRAARPTEAQADVPAAAREVIEPLKEPVTIRKALRAGRTARVVLSGGGGPMAAVHLVNIGLTGWIYTKETAEAYANGFNQAAKWMQDAMRNAPANVRAEPAGIVHRPAPNGDDFSVEWLSAPVDGAKLYTTDPGQAETRAATLDEQAWTYLYGNLECLESAIRLADATGNSSCGATIWMRDARQTR